MRDGAATGDQHRPPDIARRGGRGHVAPASAPDKWGEVTPPGLGHARVDRRDEQ